MPPEFINNLEYTDKSEIWILGCYIYYIYFKKFPFKTISEIFAEPDVPSNFVHAKLLSRIFVQNPE